jgi:hypothetical protein
MTQPHPYGRTAFARHSEPQVKNLKKFETPQCFMLQIIAIDAPIFLGTAPITKNIRVVGHHQTFKLIKPLLQPNAAVILTVHGGF